MYLQHNKAGIGMDMPLFLERTRFVLLDLLRLNYDLTFEEAEMVVGQEIPPGAKFDAIAMGPVVMGGQALRESLASLDKAMTNIAYTDHRYN